jgi:hypothetical protein
MKKSTVHGIVISRKAVFAAAVACLIATGCAKMPEKLVSPTLKIEPVIADNKEMFKLALGTGLQNENGSTALLNVRGNIYFKDKDAGKGAGRILPLAFEIPIILPFDTGLIDISKTFTDKEIMPLVTLLGSDIERLRSEKGLDHSFVDDTTIGFELTGYEKKDIIDVLKEHMNEKNK